MEKAGTKTTYNVGIIEGGTSVNTIAQRASMLCEYRSDDRESLAYFHKVLKKAKVFDQLEALGVQDGDTVSIYGFEFDYVK